MRLRGAKVAERIDVLFGVETLGNPMHIVSDGILNPDPLYGNCRG